MNRKLLVNELLGWSDLNESNNENIISLIETQFKSYPEIKRKKTPPKKIRIKLKENMDIMEQSPNLAKYLKSHLRFGINSITKELEKGTENNILFVLVCKSVKPLLTRHLQVMCAKLNIPAGCVYNLSEKLAKYFNLKTIGAFALTKEESINTDSELSKQARELILDLANKIIPILPLVRNPFKINHDLPRVDLKINEKDNDEVKTQIVELLDNKEIEEMDTFGSDFISLDKKNSKTSVNFDSNKFILFNDDFSEDDTENNSSNKRKSINSNFEFNQFTIRFRETNENRKKKNDLINQMKTNKFKSILKK